MRQIKSVPNQYDSVHTCSLIADIYKYTKYFPRINLVTAARPSKIATLCKDAKRRALVLVCAGWLCLFCCPGVPGSF